MNFKLSVLIPVYNVAPYIEKCLRSVFSNTIIADCEVIIVDDGSTDNSIQLVESLLPQFSELKNNIVSLSHGSNKGSAFARNTLLNHANGKYIIFVDSDDWVEPNYLEELYNVAEKENADITGCDVFSEFPNRTEIKEQKIESTGKDCIRSMFLTKTNGWLPLKFIKKELIEEHSITFVSDINILEDLIFATKCFYYAQKTAYVNKPLYHYNRRSDSYMGSLTTEKKASEIVHAVSVIESFLSNKGENELFESLLFLKIHLKKRILFKGVRSVQKKYIALWREIISVISAFPTSRFHRFVLSLAFHKPKTTEFLLLLYSFLRCLIKREKFSVYLKAK